MEEFHSSGGTTTALKPTKQLPHLCTFVHVTTRMPLGTADLIAIFKTWNNAQDIRNETHIPVGGTPDKKVVLEGLKPQMALSGGFDLVNTLYSSD